MSSPGPLVTSLVTDCHCPFISSVKDKLLEQMLDSVLKAGSSINYHRENTMLLQAGGLLQDGTVSVMALAMNRRYKEQGWQRKTKVFTKNTAIELAWAAISGAVRG